MIEFLKGLANLNQFEIQPHIYEAEASGYGLMPGSSFVTEVSPEWIARSNAKLVV